MYIFLYLCFIYLCFIYFFINQLINFEWAEITPSGSDLTYRFKCHSDEERTGWLGSLQLASGVPLQVLVK